MTQAQFYRSGAWKRLARAFMLSKSYICERCGKPAEIVHHKKRITPANLADPAITLNADNLEAVCIECHNGIHFGAGGAVLRGLEFDENGDLKRRITCEL
jgi:5-methylcytosine-specific restriction endonuclease McrA